MTDEAGSADAANPETSEASVTEAAEVPAAAPTSLLDSIQDADLRSYAEGKGFDKAGFEGVVKSYSHLEKLAKNHETTVVIPGLEATPEQRSEFYNRLGRPKEANAYSFKLDEGADTGRLDAMRSKAHELGITDAQFSGLATADMEYLGAMQQNVADDQAISRADAETQLKKEWGAAYEMKSKAIEEAASKLGLDTNVLAGLSEVLGPFEAMRFVDGLNTKIGDHRMENGESVATNHKTPEQARVALGELSMNKEFTEAWLDRMHPGHKAAVEKKAGLARMASGIAP